MTIAYLQLKGMNLGRLRTFTSRIFSVEWMLLWEVKVALSIAKLFNKKSILDWKALHIGKKIFQIPNPSFNENSPKLDKEEILKKIREDN